MGGHEKSHKLVLNFAKVCGRFYSRIIILLLAIFGVSPTVGQNASIFPEQGAFVGAPAFRARIPGLRTRFAFPRIVLAYTGRHIHKWGFLTKGKNGDNG